MVFVLITLAGMMLPREASAFVLSDGTEVHCDVSGQAVPEIEIPTGERVGFTGRTVRTSAGHQIRWNPNKLSRLPAAVHDFLFFHECAHAKIPTEDELKANCAGLKDMRAAGRAGLAIESKLTAFYGPTNPYWVKTLQCALETSG